MGQQVVKRTPTKVFFPFRTGESQASQKKEGSWGKGATVLRGGVGGSETLKERKRSQIQEEVRNDTLRTESLRRAAHVVGKALSTLHRIPHSILGRAS